ncbi:VanZ family protein [Ruminococcaceae bacterium OttesenSCG-928-I18]|nr:VanZ family protein [Ruminococcaceae bacterium OttesenSCG-928-I18]
METTKTPSALSVIMKILFTLLLAATVFFIFYQSSRIGEVSSGLSLRVTEKLNAWLYNAGLGVQLSHNTVRKLGHLGEYILLGFWTMLTLRVYTGRVIAFIAWPLLFGLGLAVADEFLQQYIPGRTSSVTDVVIDFCGVILGLSIALAILLLVTGIARLFTRR